MIESTTPTTRCPWCAADPLYVAYHDEEWGVAEHDDRALFEKLILDGFQAGLSWLIILKKRQAFRAAFDDFDPQLIAGYDARKIDTLLKNAAIVRNRAKIEATVGNAQAYLKLKDELGSFDTFLWQFVAGKTRQNRFTHIKELPPQTSDSEAMSKALKKRGFRFCGPTICYAFMQAVGMVNDHLVDCFRYREVIDHCDPRPNC
ncbi:MAG: DNA-3-methyladenine glycosylase I [Myxococcota bacterium]